MARSRKRSPARRLRNAVAALPDRTREAMLRGIARNRIIAGAYADKRGGVCPMLAAHRNGGRTNFGAFARAWDEFTRAGKGKPRRARPREVRYLRSLLERDLARQPRADSSRSGSLVEAVRDVQASRRRLAETEAREATRQPIEEALAIAVAVFEERRAERRADELLDQPGAELLRQPAEIAGGAQPTAD